MSGCSGRASAIGHAGELLQGVLDRDGERNPFLVTLPAPCLTSGACAEAGTAWSIEPAWKVKALSAARLAAAELEIREPYRLVIESNIPVGRGLGSSTADCVAAIRAMSRLAHAGLTPERVADLTMRAEVACDSTMFDDETVVFLPRKGAVVERFLGQWPALWVEILDLGGPPVDTVHALPPDYSPDQVQAFERLLAELRLAFERGDPDAIGRVATASGEIHQRHRPAAAWPKLVRESLEKGAYGVARAHSGTAAAVLARQPLGFSALSYRLG